jgi:hypothetical protein
VFFEMVGFDQATIARVNSQMRMNQARQNMGIQPILQGRTFGGITQSQGNVNGSAAQPSSGGSGDQSEPMRMSDGNAD